MHADQKFIPALGKSSLTGSYDRVVAVMSRERRWRSALADLIAPSGEDSIVDFGAGTGTLCIELKRRAPGCRLVGIDPDPQVLAIARAKAETLGMAIDWHQAMGDRAGEVVADGSATKVVSSLVLHHCDLPMKRAMLRVMGNILRPGGHLFIADYGRQRTLGMRASFLLVQAIDGFKTTGQNARGMLPQLIAEAGFAQIVEDRVVPTPTGSISLYTARKP
ncbi:class I SAM-dependent methyltransferase [Sphingomonas alpina]|uniref:Class I SAM-dependent methyltransferase n=1 Tax=Sphingomonas alpina TaxID=653931 RepID=A0A7H0LKR4_9SPHN|nr:class I SAM-dependent methyltransferase [Sphingomonas alpina]QNQ10267.1 class I SAM-dependent methyltransferase [Sphingomonas alpina]